MKDFYVYVHRRASDGKVFYVGKGRKRRAWIHSGRPTHWQRIVRKHGLDVEILAQGLSETCAFSIERAVIRGHGRSKLINRTDGGEGASGLVVSEERRRAVAEANARRKITEETRSRLSASHRGIVKSPETRAKLSASNSGKPKSEEHKEKLRQANLGKRGSEEARRKMSEARRGRARPPFSEEWKSKISEARTDSELHTMVHEQYGTLTALRSYFKTTFGVDTAAI